MKKILGHIEKSECKEDSNVLRPELFVVDGPIHPVEEMAIMHGSQVASDLLFQVHYIRYFPNLTDFVLRPLVLFF